MKEPEEEEKRNSKILEMKIHLSSRSNSPVPPLNKKQKVTIIKNSRESLAIVCFCVSVTEFSIPNLSSVVTVLKIHKICIKIKKS